MSDSLTLDVGDLTPEQVADILRFVASLREAEIDEREVDDGSWRDAVSTGWTLAHVTLLREHLEERGKDVQLAAFDLAIKQGGFVSRASVYRLGDYDDSRRLNNWTAPFVVAADWLEDEHGLTSPEYPVWAVYDPDMKGFQRALGFEVLPEIVKLVREDQESSSN
ncbi:hypothetical protein Gbro_4905 (plasmid) [Gordonia bronchialis DSM 43247]|uniref:Uncharacterized protein n=1 Tax=Gordonia bronchialis (strain ATCC 25592 / DSM 43247 / BCRC 13721 / JCM 3198 / KCTC 3076 / NBRC 16047 / NCTC 10667) TaxID=526226 RepID=D0LFG9_GORB4|nr:hypothetical protein [Gordonia bronchialis]ACY24018.1 hypothetical protein Gbro_4905 [Gordonia bronchialis DSM 43247]MCC3326011.1 hypothetical protein [Gordonia bronchialis]QGS27341.1 hypothetical protein FOB84_24475 [Gordonia bronchialis]STS10822.1 Uncharacterised protein [Gordonia bronchialis]